MNINIIEKIKILEAYGIDPIKIIDITDYDPSGVPVGPNVSDAAIEFTLGDDLVSVNAKFNVKLKPKQTGLFTKKDNKEGFFVPPGNVKATIKVYVDNSNYENILDINLTPKQIKSYLITSEKSIYRKLNIKFLDPIASIESPGNDRALVVIKSNLNLNIELRSGDEKTDVVRNGNIILIYLYELNELITIREKNGMASIMFCNKTKPNNSSFPIDECIKKGKTYFLEVY